MNTTDPVTWLVVATVSREPHPLSFTSSRRRHEKEEMNTSFSFFFYFLTLDFFLQSILLIFSGFAQLVAKMLVEQACGGILQMNE